MMLVVFGCTVILLDILFDVTRLITDSSLTSSAIVYGSAFLVEQTSLTRTGLSAEWRSILWSFVL